MLTSTISSQGQTTVPKAVRDALDLASQAVILWQPEADGFRVRRLVPEDGAELRSFPLPKGMKVAREAIVAALHAEREGR